MQLVVLLDGFFACCVAQCTFLQAQVVFQLVWYFEAYSLDATLQYHIIVGLYHYFIIIGGNMCSEFKLGTEMFRECLGIIFCHVADFPFY